jgi:hypothetical protein
MKPSTESNYIGDLMNLQDTPFNPAAVDEALREPTITIDDKTYTVAELVANAFDKAIAASLTAADGVREAVERTIAASRHNADLLEALEDGRAFRIAFKKKGETDWTRVRIEEEGVLKLAAMEEIGLRQAGIMSNLGTLLGVETFSIDNI